MVVHAGEVSPAFVPSDFNETLEKTENMNTCLEVALPSHFAAETTLFYSSKISNHQQSIIKSDYRQQSFKSHIQLKQFKESISIVAKQAPSDVGVTIETVH